MPSYPFFIVDVFAEKPFSGNQLSVFLGNPPTPTMQAMSLEMNYSETTFITSESKEANGGWNTRIFTPANEVPFAGHPTLGTAFVVATQLQNGTVKQVRLNEQVGQIPVDFGEDGVLWMTQNPPEFGAVIEHEEIAEVLNMPLSAMDARYPAQVVSTGLPSIICPMKTRADVQAATLNGAKFDALLTRLNVPHLDAVFVVCPQPVDPENDFHARMIWMDELGIVEDPATGSSNGNFAGWLARHRYFGSADVQAQVEQGYGVRRPSLLRLKAHDNGETVSVQVGGRVRLVAKGDLYVDDE